MPELRPQWEAYFAAMSEVSRQLMRIFAVGLGLDVDYFEDKIDRHISMFRVLNYPDQPEAPLEGQLRAGAHSDYGSLTIVRQEQRPGGLQVMTKSDGWMDVPAIPGALVVNIGDLMAEWTNDRWVSTLHRVVNPPRDQANDSRRISLVFFHQPNYDALIECLPTCRAPGEEAHHAPITLRRPPVLEVRQADDVRPGRQRLMATLMVGISLASFISERFVELFEFYRRTFDLPEVESLRSDIFRGADADGVTIGFSAPVVYEMLHIEPWRDARGTTQYLTFECASRRGGRRPHGDGGRPRRRPAARAVRDVLRRMAVGARRPRRQRLPDQPLPLTGAPAVPGRVSRRRGTGARCRGRPASPERTRPSSLRRTDEPSDVDGEHPAGGVEVVAVDVDDPPGLGDGDPVGLAVDEAHLVAGADRRPPSSTRSR